jgi:putative tricarboxylic transport membrane protein
VVRGGEGGEDHQLEHSIAWQRMRSHILVAVILLVLAGYIFLAAGDLPFGTLRVPQSAFFPKILAALLTTLSLLMLIRPAAALRTAEDASAIDAGGWRRIGVTLVAMAGFVLVLEPLGFLLAAFLSMIALLRAVEAQSWRRIIVIAAAAALVSHLVFARFLGVPLPAGVLGI